MERNKGIFFVAHLVFWMLKGKHMNLTNLDMPLGSGHGLLSILWESFRIPQGRSYWNQKLITPNFVQAGPQKRQL